MSGTFATHGDWCRFQLCFKKLRLFWQWQTQNGLTMLPAPMQSEVKGGTHDKSGLRPLIVSGYISIWFLNNKMDLLIMISLTTRFQSLLRDTSGSSCRSHLYSHENNCFFLTRQAASLCTFMTAFRYWMKKLRPREVLHYMSEVTQIAGDAVRLASSRTQGLMTLTLWERQRTSQRMLFMCLSCPCINSPIACFSWFLRGIGSKLKQFQCPYLKLWD